MNLLQKVYILCFVSGILLSSCSSEKAEPLASFEIKEGWEFRLASKPDSIQTSLDNQWMPANVPGTVHTDLLDNKKIEDPFYRDNEKKVQWVERVDWEYRTTFNVAKDIFNKENIDLIFEGLDTYAQVYLNDSLILSADNMFISYEAAIKKVVREGENSLRIYFKSPVAAGIEKLRKSPYLVPAHNELAPVDQRTSVFTRKAPFHYGWDWGPRLVTSGIWRPVVLKAWDNARIETIFIQQKNVDSSKASFACQTEIIADKDADIKMRISINGTTFPEEKSIQVKKGMNVIHSDFDINNPKLWWTKGLGDPNLYTVEASLVLDEVIIDTHTEKIGIRTLELVQQPDSVGNSFYFKLNGVPVFMKGSNYIPSDNFIPRVTEEKYRKVIKAATDANMNMLRVWGGAIYENDLFYDLCDQNGILVWQDFMFACSMMPGDSAHLENIKREFDYNIKRLRNHPSIALYCGNNENMIAWFNWGWKDIYKYSSEDSVQILNTYKKVMYDLLANSVKTYDSTRTFWPSSPSSGYEYNELPDNKSGDAHDWGVWFGKMPFESYETTTGRFVSEYGMQCFPEMKTIKSFSTPEDWAVRSPLFEFKQRSQMPWIARDMNGNGMIAEYVKMYYKVPKDFQDFVYVSQLMQAKGLKTAIEAHRRKMPYCMGSLYWQIDDCWPTVSWSTMDYYFRWKASHYAVRKAFQEILVSPETEGDDLNVYIVSDRMRSFNASLKLDLLDFNGNVLWSEEKPVNVKANSSSIYFTQRLKDLLGKQNGKNVLLATSLMENGKKVATNIFYFAHPKELNLPAVKPQVVVTAVNGLYEITLSSPVLAKDVYLSSESAEGFFSENYFDLLPGTSVKIYFTPSDKGNPEKDLVVKTLKDVMK